MKVRKIAIADENPLLRDCLKLALESFLKEAEFMFYHNSEGLLSALKVHDFDLVISEYAFSDNKSFSLISSILENKPKVKLLVWTNLPEDLMARSFFEMGVMGFLNKSTSYKELEDAVRIILGGEQYFTNNLKQHFTNRYISKKKYHSYETLSNREKEVALCLMDGHGVLEIANLLDLNPSTIATYRHRVFEKLNVKNVIELFRLGMTLSLVA